MDASPARFAAVFIISSFLIVISFVPDWSVLQSSPGTDPAGFPASADASLVPRCQLIELFDQDLTSDYFRLVITDSQSAPASTSGALSVASHVACEGADEILPRLRLFAETEPLVLLLTLRTSSEVYEVPIWMHMVREN